MAKTTSGRAGRAARRRASARRAHRRAARAAGAARRAARAATRPSAAAGRSSTRRSAARAAGAGRATRAAPSTARTTRRPQEEQLARAAGGAGPGAESSRRSSSRSRQRAPRQAARERHAARGARRRREAARPRAPRRRAVTLTGRPPADTFRAPWGTRMTRARIRPAPDAGRAAFVSPETQVARAPRRVPARARRTLPGLRIALPVLGHARRATARTRSSSATRSPAPRTRTSGGPGCSGRGARSIPERDFVVCSNILGSCYGTTGPAELDPATGRAVARHVPRRHRSATWSARSTRSRPRSA